MSRTRTINVGENKPHLYRYNGWWRVTHHVKPLLYEPWHQAHQQIRRWNDSNFISSEHKKSLQT